MRLLASSAILLAVLLPATARAFVFLDTSEEAPADSSRPVPKPDSTVQAPVPVPSTSSGAIQPVAPVTPAKPHFRTVLFLSADNMLVYSYLGVLKALDEFRIEVDLVVVEGKAVLVGAAWALGYPMMRLETDLARHPLSEYIRPHRERGSLASRFTPYGPDPVQIEVPFSLQSLQAPTLHWSDAPSPEGDEYLHLSWMAAKLTHDAPGGPVEDLRDAPRHLAVQVADLQDEKGKVLVEGNLQSLIKAGLLPKDALRRRKRLWPFASGSLLSGHALLPDPLPFTWDRLITVEAGRHLRPPSLEAGTEPWQDSLALRLKSRNPDQRDAGRRESLRIRLDPESGFDPAGQDPRTWVDLGYASALRSMDVLLSTLGTRTAAKESAAVDSSSEAALASKSTRLPPPLGLDRLTVNPLASGGRQLLQDLVRKSIAVHGDSSGEAAIGDLIHSGYYSDLDVEWVRNRPEEDPALVFDALERSRLVVQAGANASNVGEDLPDRGPEVLAGISWSEPFYVPFRADATLLLGGHRPGYALRGLIAPVYPVHLELGFGFKEWRIGYPEPPATVPALDPWAFRMKRSRGELFLTFFPGRKTYLSTAIQKHVMTYPTLVDTVRHMQDTDERPVNFESTDFQETGFIGFGKTGASGVSPHYLWARYRNLNRVNLFGPIKYSSSTLEGRIRFSLEDFRFLGQYYWSDQDVEDAGLYEIMEAGEVSAWSFQDEFFLGALRGAHFQNAQAEYAPTFGRAGLRLLAGGFRFHGRALQEDFEDDFTRAYWEAQVSWSTAAGPLRAGLAGLQGEPPFYFIRFGADLDLDRDGPEN